MRILWISDSPTSPSGFGCVTREVCARLARRGHAIEIIGWQTQGNSTRWEGIPVHPVRSDQFGADVVLGYALRSRPDFIVTLADVWWMSAFTDPAIQRYLDQSGARWLHYYPIDGADPEGRLPTSWCKVLERADLPVAMSRFGAEVSAASGIRAEYVPHGCDLDVFSPPADREAAKARLGYGGKFVVLCDARNQPRKLLPRLLDVAARFLDSKPDALFHLHTDPNDDAASSELYAYRLTHDLDALGLRERVRLTPGFRMVASGGLPADDLAAIYAASDAHLLCSWGEGFGLPNLQASAAGVVPLAVAYSASRELVEGHGFAIPIESSLTDEFGLVRCLLSREAAVEALETLYFDPAELERRSRRSREFALAYSWDRVADEWERVLRAAPPRRRATRTLTWITGRGAQDAAVPDPVREAFRTATSELADGTRLTVAIAERRHGEVGAEIRRAAFVKGDELSIPVRLPPAFAGAPRAQVGRVMVSPPELPLAALARRIFPGLTFGVPRRRADPTDARPLPLEELLPGLLHCCLVMDFSGTGAPGMDVACAALGVPYVGRSLLWPDVPASSPLHQVRRLLTDQGLSEWRRRDALARLQQANSPLVEQFRAIALAGQPKPREAPARPQADAEMFLVRPRAGSEGGIERIAERVAAARGFVLMATAGGGLIVAMPGEGRPKEILESFPEVEFAGGIRLSADGKGVRQLRSHFARNVALQVAARRREAAADHVVGASAARSGP